MPRREEQIEVDRSGTETYRRELYCSSQADCAQELRLGSGPCLLWENARWLAVDANGRNIGRAVGCVVRAVGCVVKVSARGSEGHRFDTQLHQLSD